MYIRTIISACTLLILPGIALADPTGTFKVVGKNADDGSTYTGTVKITRTGATYKVVWNIGGTESVGTGLGSRFDGHDIESGHATADDTGISVGYVSKDSYGIAVYYEQSNGNWEGVWSYGGSKGVTNETWIPE
ncbi:hypothetical protein DTW90_31505 [Neorhizobium sp. P12A]|uniref:hypothetical protein n=1 Tax=Neorhizobium sp. P12A TaxID=2268027 RepID=UPI0011ECBC74|nr:hypothetical protein [Neorhizobium sp. P12A]KAA0689432.1 hypothetical protein DTW90_31505 [Neorhizobium sp. P12A]